MVNDLTDPFGPLIRKLNRFRKLDEADEGAIRALPLRLLQLRSNTFVAREGERSGECSVLLEGFTCRYKVTSEGGRQMVSFDLPGDVLNIQQLLLTQADHSVQTITEATLALVAVRDLKLLIHERPTLSEALWHDSFVSASIFREWVLNVGRRDAKARIAHMLCEFAARRQAAGLGSPERFVMPMTQEQIADATGLTPIHVNRMLRALSDDGVIARDRREILIADWERMQRVADFHPDYLHEAA